MRFLGNAQEHQGLAASFMGTRPSEQTQKNTHKLGFGLKLSKNIIYQFINS
jgi:hypothetical protein